MTLWFVSSLSDLEFESVGRFLFSTTGLDRRLLWSWGKESIFYPVDESANAPHATTRLCGPRLEMVTSQKKKRKKEKSSRGMLPLEGSCRLARTQCLYVRLRCGLIFHLDIERIFWKSSKPEWGFLGFYIY